MLDLLKKSSFFLLIGVMIILIFFFTKEQEINDNPDLTTVLSTDKFQDSSLETIDNEQEIGTVFVDIKGAVEKPGVYEMKDGDRVNDVIGIAGGFEDNADESSVNLAQKVHDEMIIVVPNIIHLEDSTGQVSISTPSNNEGKVRINYATKQEIETLSGIGPSKAEAIVKYREESGYFQSVEDLLHISGIGEKTLENIEDEIQIP